MKKLSNKGKYFLEICILVSSLILACIFWNSKLFFPVKLFVVLLHETSHALVTLLTGGTVDQIAVSLQIGGSCISKGGNSAMIACAGYLGSVIFGGLLFYSSCNFNFNRILSNMLAILFLLILILFVRGTLGIALILGIILFLALSPRLLPRQGHLILTSILGALSLLYAVIDMQEDLFQDGYRQTDAQLIASLTGIPALIWSLLWMAIAVLILFFLLKKKFRVKW
ncbi:MAG: M50 family metallopeptidase [Bacillota bacterium]